MEIDKCPTCDRLAAELAEAKSEHERSLKIWSANDDQLNAEIEGLKGELAEAQAEVERCRKYIKHRLEMAERDQEEIKTLRAALSTQPAKEPSQPERKYREIDIQKDVRMEGDEVETMGRYDRWQPIVGSIGEPYFAHALKHLRYRRPLPEPADQPAKEATGAQLPSDAEIWLESSQFPNCDQAAGYRYGAIAMRDRLTAVPPSEA